MNTNERLDLLEKKIDLIMNRLGLSIEEPKQEVQPKIDDSKIRLELQKVLNEIRVCKIRFRKASFGSPIRQQSINRIEELKILEQQYSEQLNELHRKV